MSTFWWRCCDHQYNSQRQCYTTNGDQVDRAAPWCPRLCYARENWHTAKYTKTDKLIPYEINSESSYCSFIQFYKFLKFIKKKVIKLKYIFTFYLRWPITHIQYYTYNTFVFVLLGYNDRYHDRIVGMFSTYISNL